MKITKDWHPLVGAHLPTTIRSQRRALASPLPSELATEPSRDSKG